MNHKPQNWAVAIMFFMLTAAWISSALAAEYKLQSGGDGIVRVEDGAFIPATLGNRDWREYQDWIAAGNTPLAADLPPQPPPDPNDELEAALNALKGTGATIDQLIDALLGQAGKAGRIAGRP